VTDEVMAFFAARPGALPIYEAFEARLFALFPDTEMRVQKTQISFYASCGYVSASIPSRRVPGVTGPYLMLSVYLPYPLASPRVFAAVQPYPGRFTHHIALDSPDAVDGELMGWLSDAHAFARSRKGRAQRH
jgi:hypothetical protein